ncbi:MAG TPA: class I SAM-dependent RNA methyltransferase [Firmicutes bacterium]|nr:class I SAM-dependent RNA methyltransferase [Bacillota bacterium]
MAKIELIATAAFGLEAVVAAELKELGYKEQMVENGRVTFYGDEEAICRTNLWLRSADRVLVKVGEFEARTFDELFEGTKALPWPEWLPADAAFPVTGKAVKSKLFSVPDCQAIVKKAVVEKMKQAYHRNWFPENGASYKIEVALLKDRATLTLDTSGAGLHKRGYRELAAAAPLRETLAAALVRLSKWPPERVLADPFCGSGTIPIEAALLALNIAPGGRRRFSAENWSRIPERLWRLARQEAEEVARRERKVRILGTDIDEKVLRLARHHARRAGLENVIHFQRLPFSAFRSRFEYGCLLCNPPYGERLGEVREAEKIYRELGRLLREQLPTWSCFVLTSHKGFERLFGRPAAKKRKLYNGRIECHFYQYFGPEPTGGRHE